VKFVVKCVRLPSNVGKRFDINNLSLLFSTVVPLFIEECGKSFHWLSLHRTKKQGGSCSYDVSAEQHWA